MRAIMVMFDSLNRRLLPNYGCDWVKAPNFQRLGERSVCFTHNYVGSLPCMPARRDLHTGRVNFLHRSWGPMEPFDFSMPEALKKNGICSHLVSDHYHYWEDGGATYHTRYSSWDVVRGQEGDPWKGIAGHISVPDYAFNLGKDIEQKPFYRQDQINRTYVKSEADHPQTLTFDKGIEFLEANHDRDNWFLQIENFDPHEPFFSMQKYKDLYPDGYTGPAADWPPYNRATETPEFIKHVRNEYAALLSMCDHSLGRVLDMMDKYDLWKDTMLIVNTDHGYLLGEHGWWAKSVMPVYEELAHTPFFIWDPRVGAKGETRDAITQTIDVAPTLLDYFNLPIPPEMTGKNLLPVLQNDTPVRDYAVFGFFGGHLNCVDGRYFYMRASEPDADNNLYEYTLMPTHMRGFFSDDSLKKAELVKGFDFMRGVPVLKIPFERRQGNPCQFGTMLFDMDNDPGQEHPIQDEATEKRLCGCIAEFMRQHDAPSEQYGRYGLMKNDGKED